MFYKSLKATKYIAFHGVIKDHNVEIEASEYKRKKSLRALQWLQTNYTFYNRGGTLPVLKLHAGGG